MNYITQINENVFRATLPYKTIFTTVWIIKTEIGSLLFDCGSYDNDARDYIIPFIESLGITKADLKYVFISHDHSDHSGGLKGFLKEYPDVCVLSLSSDLKARYGEYNVFSPSSDDFILGCLKAIPIMGHTIDSCALLDTRTNSLYTGDCLQFYGICGNEAWASNIYYPAEHFAALERIEQLSVNEIYAAHDYYPYGYKYIGMLEIAAGIDACRKPLYRLKKLIIDNPSLSDCDIQTLYNNDPAKPTLSTRVVGIMRDAIAKGTI